MPGERCTNTVDTIEREELAELLAASGRQDQRAFAERCRRTSSRLLGVRKGGGKDVAKTVEGDTLTVSRDAQGVAITDVNPSNGVIHVVDTVSMPQASRAPLARDICDLPLAPTLPGHFLSLPQ